MNVLHVIPSLNPATGGPPMVAARLAAAQSGLGCRCAIVSYLFPEAQADITRSLSTIPDFSSVRCDFLPPLTRRERLLARGARRDLAPLIEAADIVHLHGVWDPIVAAAAGAAHELCKPYCLTPHGMLDPWALDQKKYKKKFALWLTYRRMLNRAAFLHFLNADELALTADLKLTARPQIIPNGIFLQEIEPLPARGGFHAAHPELNGRPFVLFLSRLHYKKGLDYLADAFAVTLQKMPEVKLVVAGPDDGAGRDFAQQVRALRVESSVHMVGPLYGPQKIQALVDADCFCLPSRQEGFSLAITEALACGTPVVISDACHFPEVGDAGAGIIVPLEAQRIAGALGKVLEDRQAAAKMGKAGRELVLTRFTWPSVARRMVESYEEALHPVASG